MSGYVLFGKFNITCSNVCFVRVQATEAACSAACIYVDQRIPWISSTMTTLSVPTVHVFSDDSSCLVTQMALGLHRMS